MLTAFAILSNIIAAFILGKLHERMEWNTLIKEGKINKPSHKNNH